MSVKLSRSQEIPSCNKCLTSLMGRQYLMKASQKFCVECFEGLFCNSCHTCGKIIPAGTKDISYKSLHFHDECFNCSGCSKSLTGRRFVHKDQKFICEVCFENRFSPKCSVCKKAFKPGIKRLEYDGLNYHEKCFCCTSCGGVIGKKSFVKKEDEVFCEACFESQLADVCAKCNKIIKTTGVSYKNNTYHSSCFVCGSCEKVLKEEQFVTHENLPYCVQCHTSEFAKKCYSCNKPITGICEDKMIECEGYNWHLECFQCEVCSKSLEGQGFVLHEDNTYCEICVEDL